MAPCIPSLIRGAGDPADGSPAPPRSVASFGGQKSCHLPTCCWTSSARASQAGLTALECERAAQPRAWSHEADGDGGLRTILLVSVPTQLVPNSIHRHPTPYLGPRKFHGEPSGQRSEEYNALPSRSLGSVVGAAASLGTFALLVARLGLRKRS